MYLFDNAGGYAATMDDWEAGNVTTAAPVITGPSGGTPGATTIAISATTDTLSTGSMFFLRRVGGSAAAAATILSTGESQATTGSNPQTRNMTGFTASSVNNYVDIAQTGPSNVVTVGPFTMAAADSIAPTLSSPTGASAAPLLCTGSVSTNEGNGTLYGVVTASATAPTAGQVKLGQDHTGTAALRVVSQAVSGTGAQSIASGAVTAGTRYWHYMHEDAATNQSAVVSSASFVVAASYVVTTDALRNESDTILASTTINKVVATRLSDLVQVCTWADQVTSAGGVLTLSHASLTAVAHIITTSNNAGSASGAKVYTPA